MASIWHIYPMNGWLPLPIVLKSPVSRVDASQVTARSRCAAAPLRSASFTSCTSGRPSPGWLEMMDI